MLNMDKLAWVAKFIHTPKHKEKGKTGWGALIGQSSIRGKRETILRYRIAFTYKT